MGPIAAAALAILAAGARPPAPATNGTSIIAAGQAFEVGRPVVLWSDEQGFDGYETRCIDQTGGCCDQDVPRYGARKGVSKRTLGELQEVVSQFVLHFDGCVNSRSCFKSMHNRPRGGAGCGLSAHFMIDADGTIYQTLDLVERAYHAEIANSSSVGVEICNRGRVDEGELHKLPREYQTRPRRKIVINGDTHLAYDFRPEQYDSIVALTRTLLRLFPRIKPVIPEKDGEPLLETLADPVSFAGILGHLHVDLERNKWDPGALDWKRILRALNGFAFPVQVRSFGELPRTATELVAARRAAFHSAEERATGFFPLAPGRLWHSGVHLRSSLGAPVHAPTRGRLVAARRGEHQGSATGFALIRHDLDVGGERVQFHTLLMHLALPAAATPNAEVPWVQAIARGPAARAAAYAAGSILLLDERVEAGDLVGHVGPVRRGPEQGPELHLEVMSADKLPGELGRAFLYLNASADGPIARRADLLALADRDGDQQIDQAELERLYRQGDLDRRQPLRRVAVRHRHEWGDRTTAAELAELRELSALPEAERRRLHAVAIAPYVFWTDAVARHAGLPENQIVYSYNAVTFLLELAARGAQVSLPRERGALRDEGVEPRRLPADALAVWTRRAEVPWEPPVFKPPVGKRLGPRRKSDIQLIELPSTDAKR